MNTNLAFDYNCLFNKAKLYVNRAMEEERERELFPFWLSLSLELLARSTLAKINPVLLADASNNDAQSLLYALGYESTKKPKSISTINVFERLTRIDIEFTKKDSELCALIIDQRNHELHSGLKGYSDFPVGLWLSDYYRICKKLLSAQTLTLENFLGVDEAKAAERMMEVDAEKTKKVILDKIQAYKKVFFEYSEQVREQKKTVALNQNKLHKNSKQVSCPCCDSQAFISGELISISNPKLSEGLILEEKRYLPTLMFCFVCSLNIAGYSELKAIDLGSQFSILEELDPVEYHNIDVEEYIDASDFIAKHLSDEYQDE